MSELGTAAKREMTPAGCRNEIYLASRRMRWAEELVGADQWDDADKWLMEASMKIERAREGIRWLQQQRGKS